jgi:hypothetical protein
MGMGLTNRELELIIGWRGKPFWPDEERVLRKLRRALESSSEPRVSRLQLRIIYGWVEEQVGGHYGSAVANPEEQAVMVKLRQQLEQGA